MIARRIQAVVIWLAVAVLPIMAPQAVTAFGGHPSVISIPTQTLRRPVTSGADHRPALRQASVQSDDAALELRLPQLTPKSRYRSSGGTLRDAQVIVPVPPGGIGRAALRAALSRRGPPALVRLLRAGILAATPRAPPTPLL